MIVIVLMSIFTFIGNIFYWDMCRYLNNPGIARRVFSGILIILLPLISAFSFNNNLSVNQRGSILLILFGIGSLLITD
jgi:multidrug transporter EmrE-like cation transporter